MGFGLGKGKITKPVIYSVNFVKKTRGNNVIKLINLISFIVF